MKQRVVVYQETSGRKEVFVIGNSAEAEQHERAHAQREMQDPRSNIVSFSFEWRGDEVVNGRHSWYEQ